MINEWYIDNKKDRGNDNENREITATTKILIMAIYFYSHNNNAFKSKIINNWVSYIILWSVMSTILY